MKNIWRTNILYYISITMPILVSGVLFFLIFQNARFEDLDSWETWFLFFLKLFWLTGIVVALSNIFGLIWFGNPEKANNNAENKFKINGWNDKNLLIVVYVSRGDNVRALQRAVVETEKILVKNKINHRVDIVTDIPVHKSISDKNSNKLFHLVPKGYTTLNGAKWKARALHYVVEQHKMKESDSENELLNKWVLHLDEESVLTKSAVAGITEFVNNPQNINCIGQGEIKYNAHNYGEHLIITWIDCIRSGDDLGRFRLQFALFERPLFGMHGSYILAPYHIEQKFGFDLGRRGSVTEDAYFALKCSEMGVLFRWVNGYIREQSPFSIMAIAKQRRRWFRGLLTLSFDKEISFRIRLPLMVNTLLWAVAWIGPIVTILTIIFGGYFPFILLAISALLQGFYASVYMVGAMRNISDVKDELSYLRKIYIYGGSLIGVHVASLVEGFAVLYAIISPVKTFDVVDKN